MAASMISSGFRPPQFSEDRDWLPAWLQQHQESLPDDDNNNIKYTQSLFTGACKVQGNDAFERDVLLSAREDNGPTNFRLLLSGSDSSPFQMTPSGNFLHFHLHLSSNGMSQYTPSPSSSALQKERDESNDIPCRQLLSQTACPHNRSLPYGKEDEHGLSSATMDLKSRMNPRSRSPSVSKDEKSSQKKHQEKANRRDLVTADITNAVELSIAASEALAISDLVNSGRASEFLEASAVLEVALHLKQARNQLCTISLDNLSNSVTDMVDEGDLLQELDDDIMADAYVDVGLYTKPVESTVDNPCSSKAVPEHRCSLSGTVSRVLCTPDPEDHYGGNVRVENAKLRSQEVEFDGISYQRENEDALTMYLTSKDSPSDSLLGMRQENLSGPNFVVDTFSAETHSEPHLNQFVHRKTEGTINQIISNAIDCGSLSNIQENLPSSVQIHNQGNDGAKGETFSTTPGIYRSRWLGGWTGEDANVAVYMPQNTVKRITNFVTRETSYISESADIIPEENSSVKKPEIGQVTASLSSVAYEGLCSTTRGMELSQDLMSPCNLSMVDPLCSVVPCSISSAVANVNTNTNQLNRDLGADNSSNAFLENELGDLRTTLPSADFGDEGHKLNINENSVASTRRRLTSLKTYSMLTPPWKADLERSDQCRSVPVTGMSEFLTFEENIDCFKSTSRKETNLYCKRTSKSTSVEYYGTENATLPVRRLFTISANDKEHNDENRSSPLIFNRRARRRVRASKILPSDESGGLNSGTTSMPKELENRDELCQPDRSTLAPTQSFHSSHPNPCNDHGPSRKKVRFSEADAIIVEKRSAQKPQSVYRTRSSIGTGKRLKKFNLQPESRKNEANTCVKNGVTRDKRRMMFKGLEFLLTGFTCKKERELEMLIRKHGGFVVFDVPPPPFKRTKQRFRCKLQQLPVLLSPKKLQTHKFLYACAVNAFVLHGNWLTDSIGAGQLLTPEKYTILPILNSMKHRRVGQPVQCSDITYIFDKLGILLHGSHSFCTNMGKIFKHGGGQVFKTIQWLVQSLRKGAIFIGAIVVEDESSASRHLRHCASEQNLPVMPANWITESLLLQKLIPLKESRSFPLATTKMQERLIAMQMSEEI